MAIAKKKPTHYQSLKHLSAVDADKGIISGVSVIRIGPALGHGVYIDQKGLEMSLAALKAQGEDGIKMTNLHDGEFEDIVGAVKDFRIDGDRIRGDAYLLDNHESRAHILEIAQKMPGQFGLSIESYGEDEPNPGGDGKLFRPDEIDAVALVPRPAANKGGLFARKVDKTPKPNTSPKFFHMAKSKFSVALLAACTKFAEGITPDGGETPSAEAIADVVTQAVSDVIEAQLQPAVEDAVNDAVDDKTADFSRRLKKLEEGSEPDPAKDDDDKGDDSKNLAAIVRTELKKHFGSTVGADRAPKQGQDRGPVSGGKTEFELKAEELAASGVKNFFSAAVNRHPDLFKKHCELKQGKQA